MWEIYESLINGIPEDLKVIDYLVGIHWTLVRSERGVGVAKTLKGGRPEKSNGQVIGIHLKELAEQVKSWNMLSASLGMAAINSVLNTQDNLVAITDPMEGDCDGDESGVTSPNAFDALAVEGKRVAVVGHFPRAENLGEVCKLSIIDGNSHYNDFPVAACEYILPDQDVVFITGTAFINKTIPRLLELTNKAQVVLLGPSTPLTQALFNYGVDVIAGMLVTDEKQVWEAVMQGGNRNIYERGGQRVMVGR